MSTAVQRAVTPYLESEIRTAGGFEVRRVLRSCAPLGLIWAALWVLAAWAARSFPYVRPGSDTIYTAKAGYIQSHRIFADQPVKVLVLGNSKVLSGFIPSQFDQQVPGATSFNAGFPNAHRFLPQLRASLQAGNVPTHILYMVGWEDDPAEAKSIFHYLPADRDIMNWLFPFRMLLRDSAVFLLRSRSFGGPAASYQHAAIEVEKMKSARGYYFIEGQSRFADHRLPPDFRLASDDPSQVPYRNAAVNSDSFGQLKELADQYHFHIVVMPYYLRQSERGAAGHNTAMESAFRSHPEFSVQGDEYYQFDNRYFSDTAHLNPEGAQIYTSKIAGLMEQELAKESQ